MSIILSLSMSSWPKVFTLSLILWLSHLHPGEPQAMSVLCSALLSFTNSFTSSFSFLSPVFLLPLSHFLSLFLWSSSISPRPTSPSRYLTPCSKSDYYVTEWVEDVNKNTEGPYIRYYLRLLYIPPRIHFALFFFFFFICIISYSLRLVLNLYILQEFL